MKLIERWSFKMTKNYRILPILSGERYVYNGKIYSEDNLGVKTEVFSIIEYLRLSFNGHVLPTISGNHYSCDNPDIPWFFGADEFVEVAKWCLCNRDLTQPLFEKHGFDITATTRDCFSPDDSCSFATCKNEKWGLLMEDLFSQCEEVEAD